jgi:hypothetical protein
MVMTAILLVIIKVAVGGMIFSTGMTSRPLDALRGLTSDWVRFVTLVAEAALPAPPRLPAAPRIALERSQVLPGMSRPDPSLADVAAVHRRALAHGTGRLLHRLLATASRRQVHPTAFPRAAAAT